MDGKMLKLETIVKWNNARHVSCRKIFSIHYKDNIHKDNKISMRWWLGKCHFRYFQSSSGRKQKHLIRNGHFREPLNLSKSFKAKFNFSFLENLLVACG